MAGSLRTTHTVPAEVFDLLARGDGDTLGAIRSGQRSKRLVLLRHAVSTMRRQAGVTFAAAAGEAAFAILVDAQRRSPAAVDDLLMQPHIGSWASRCVLGETGAGRVSPEDVGHLGAVAAAAAIRARQRFEVWAYAPDGGLMLPSYGLARLGGGSRWCQLRSVPAAGGVEVISGEVITALPLTLGVSGWRLWQPLRRLTTSSGDIGLTLDLDDLDPYRGCGHLPVTGRLAPGEVRSWQECLDEAWPLLEQVDGRRARAISTGVTTVVPLVSTASCAELSATCHGAVGAVAMTPPKDALALALALVHEYQHTKLSALLDLVPLIEAAPGRIFYAPWRPDPRPLRGLLQGMYAHLGLTVFWAGYRRRGGGPATTRLAALELALGCRRVRAVLDTLRSSGRLTDAGHRFARGVDDRLAALAREALPSRVTSLASMAMEDNRTSWRLRNLEPSPDLVAEWADRWLHRRAFRPPGTGKVTVRDGGGPLPSDGRLHLLRVRMSDGPASEGHGGESSADALLLGGRPAEAADRYRRRIMADPDDRASWAGLALARRYATTPATPALTRCPESVMALHKWLRGRTGSAPHPERLAAWMAAALEGDP